MGIVIFGFENLGEGGGGEVYLKVTQGCPHQVHQIKK